MSGPSDGDDSTWDQVRAQVEQALREAGLGGGSLDDAVLDGVKQAFDTLGELRDKGWADMATDTPSGPDVHVVPGGRSEDAPESTVEEEPHARPELRIAPEPEPVSEEPPARGARPEVQVNVHHLSSPTTRRRRGPSVTDFRRRGTIAVSAGDSQTLVRGASARLYRVGCTTGSLRIEVDGLPTETLQAGQDMDVEGRLLRVRADVDATGLYALVKQP